METKELLRDQMIQLAEAMKAAKGMSRAAISKAAFNDNTFFKRVEGGRNWTIDSFETLKQWFSDNWPEGAEWPSDVPRPVRSVTEPTPETCQ